MEIKTIDGIKVTFTTNQEETMRKISETLYKILMKGGQD